jgi:hypothetical protein
MAGEHDVVQIFVQDQIHDVIDVSLQIDVGIVQMFTLPETGERCAVNRVSIIGQKLASAFPFPAAGCGAVNDDEGVLL